jgi:hypothetical protein
MKAIGGNSEKHFKTLGWGLAPAGEGGCKERVQEVNIVEYYALMYANER